MTDEQLKKYLPGKRKFMVQVMLEESSGGILIDHAAKVKDILQQTFSIGCFRISGPMVFQEITEVTPTVTSPYTKKVNTVNLDESKSKETGE